MKIAVALILTLVGVGCATGQTRHWNATVKVVDENDQPVFGANVEMSWNVSTPDLSTISKKIESLTDTNGLCKLSHEASTSIGLGFVATKSGYYPARTGYELAQRSDSDPAKWNPMITLLLKKIGNPIPMYAKRVETKVQREDEPIGFDLMAGDWVAPHGQGKDTDLFFTVHRQIINAREYDCDLKLTFPNNGDGIVSAPAEPQTGSTFRTSRTAAEDGYEPERTWHFSTGVWPQPVFGYFFRVRTVLDEKGHVKSALYGKIRGDFRFYAGTQAPHAGMGFDYYLNPTPNDRNLEFDPKQNIFKELGIDEQITEP